MLAVAFFKYCTNYSLIKWKQNHECYVFFLRELGTVLAVDCILAKVQPAIGEWPIIHLSLLAGMDCNDRRQVGCNVVEVLSLLNWAAYWMFVSPSLALCKWGHHPCDLSDEVIIHQAYMSTAGRWTRASIVKFQILHRLVVANWWNQPVQFGLAVWPSSLAWFGHNTREAGSAF